MVLLHAPGVYVPTLGGNMHMICWGMLAKMKGNIFLQIWRKIHGTVSRLLGQKLQRVIAIGEIKVIPYEIIHVLPGDFLGIYETSQPVIGMQCRHSKECDEYVFEYLVWYNDTCVYPGASFTFQRANRKLNCPCLQCAIQATVKGMCFIHPSIHSSIFLNNHVFRYKDHFLFSV